MPAGGRADVSGPGGKTDRARGSGPRRVRSDGCKSHEPGWKKQHTKRVEAEVRKRGEILQMGKAASGPRQGVAPR